MARDPFRHAPTRLGLPLVLVAASLLGVAGAGGSAAADAVAKPPAPTQVRYDGKVWYEGHYRRPHEVRVYNSRAIYSSNGAGRVRVDWTTWSESDTATAVPETFLAVGDSVFHRDSPNDKWSLLAGDRRRLGMIQAVAGIPQALGRYAKAQKAGNQGEFAFEGANFEYVEKRAHPRLGDVIDSVVCNYGEESDSPVGIVIALHERDGQWRLAERLIGSPTSGVQDSLFEVPREFDSPPADADTLATDVKLVNRAPGIWTAELTDIDSRSMIVEFANYLAVIELAVGSANGERIIDAAKRQCPGKPVRYALFSHYHPHYLGGIRAAMAEGATVITTPGNKDFVKERAALPFTIQPDRLARAPKQVQARVQVRTFGNRLELADAANQLVAYNYGARSNHTDEFVVFYFPRAKLLFEAELGWSSVNGVLKAGRRATALLEWIKAQKLDVRELVQSWPMKGEPGEVSRGKLEELVAAYKKGAPKP